MNRRPHSNNRTHNVPIMRVPVTGTSCTTAVGIIALAFLSLHSSPSPASAFAPSQRNFIKRSNPILLLKMSESAANEDTKPKCIPCESLDPSSLLTLEKAQEQLSSLKLWEATIGEDRIEKISRKFQAKNFQFAMDALNDIGKLAERENHHPDLHLTSYREVEIVIYTHSVGGVTQNDLTLAKMLDDEVKIVYGPRWLKEHPDAKPSSK